MEQGRQALVLLLEHVSNQLPLTARHHRLLTPTSTSYNACSSTLQYIVDTHPHLDLELLPVVFTYPKPHAEVVRLARDAIERANSDGTGRRVRLALIDAISSAPGVVVPWEDLVELFREKDVISLVDAAHQIGQLPVSLRTSKPDFWISNCHKWLHAHRGVAVLYVDKKYVSKIFTNSNFSC